MDLMPSSIALLFPGQGSHAEGMEDPYRGHPFMERGLEKDLAAEKVALGKDEWVEAGDGVVYWRVDKGSTLQSPFGKLLTKAKYRDFNTNRNLRTLRKLI